MQRGWLTHRFACLANALDSQGQVPDMSRRTASWRNGYAEDCKSFNPGSIPGEASNPFSFWFQALILHAFCQAA